MAHVPRKRFGQHFLHDPSAIAKIVAAVDPRPGDALVEIGPGLGALTGPLLERTGRLAAIEIDRDLAARMEEAHPALTVHRGDVLEFDLGRLPEGLRVVGNLPYNVSTPFLFRLAAQAGRLRDVHVMLQREVVDRMVARPSTPAYGRLSVMLQYRFAIAKLFEREAGRVPSAAEGGLRVRADGAAARRSARCAGRGTTRARRDRGVHETPEAAAERARGGDCRRCLTRARDRSAS